MKGKEDKNYKGSFFDDLDKPVWICFLVCAGIAGLFFIWVRMADYSHLSKRTLENLPPRVLKIIMPKQPKQPVPQPQPTPGGEPGKEKITKAVEERKKMADKVERAKQSVQENVEKMEERVTKASVLAVLAGKGPATKGTTPSKTLTGAGLGDWGDLDSRLKNVEGLTQFEGRKGGTNQDGRRSGATRDAANAPAGISDLVKGFEKAKTASLSKIGNMNFERPQVMRKSAYTGSRNPEQIASLISRNQSEVSMLYEQRLRTNPSLQGKITVLFVIEENGSVSSASIIPEETTLHDSPLHSDLIRRIRQWVFPPATGGPVEMKSPFIFKPA